MITRPTSLFATLLMKRFHVLVQIRDVEDLLHGDLSGGSAGHYVRKYGVQSVDLEPYGVSSFFSHDLLLFRQLFQNAGVFSRGSDAEFHVLPCRGVDEAQRFRVEHLSFRLVGLPCRPVELIS